MTVLPLDVDESTYSTLIALTDREKMLAQSFHQLQLILFYMRICVAHVIPQLQKISFCLELF